MTNSWTRYLPVFFRDQLEGRPALLQALGNTGWLFADSILRMGVGLFVNIWTTRYLGPEQFGLLSYAVAFVMLFSPLALLGLDFIVVRNIVRAPSRRDEILGSAFALKLGAGVLASGLALAAVSALRPGDQHMHSLVGIITIGTLFQAFGTVEFWFQSQVQARYCAYARSASCLIVSAVKIALILSRAPLEAFAWAALAEVLLGFFFLVVAYRVNHLRITAWRATGSLAGELLRDSWPLICTDIVIMIYMRIDKIMIGELRGNTELGIYSVATLLAEACYFIPMAVTSSLYPSIVKAREISEEQFYDRMQRLYNLMALLGYLVAIPVSLAAWWLVPFLFGDAFSSAGAMLVGLVWAGVFFNLTTARNYFLTAMNWTRLHFFTDFLGCLLNVALNLWLIPRYGGMGAVVASFFSYWFALHGTCFLFKPLRRTGLMLTRALAYPKVW